MRALLFLLPLFVISCAPEISSIRSEIGVERQVFTIQTGRDTLLRCQDGSTIKICANSFLTTEKTVKIGVKEALTMSDMIREGLSTQTADGNILQTEGMIFLEPIQPSKLDINPEYPIRIALPVNNPQSGTRLYNGIPTENTIVWKMAENNFLNAAALVQAEQGRQLFGQYCAACHCTQLDQDLTGPALGNITLYRDKQWLRDFTRASQEMIAKPDSLAWCLWQKWKPTVMSDFKQLSDQQIDAIYAFIEQESARQKINLGPDDYNCIPKADTIWTDTPSSPASIYHEADFTPDPFEKERSQLNQYLFGTYDGWGWYNCDRLLQAENSKILFVLEIDNPEEFDVIQVHLSYPEEKILYSLWQSGKTFFPGEDYKAALPQKKAKITAIGLHDKIWYYYEKEIMLGPENRLHATLKKTTKLAMKKQFKTKKAEELKKSKPVPYESNCLVQQQ